MVRFIKAEVSKVGRERAIPDRLVEGRRGEGRGRRGI